MKLLKLLPYYFLCNVYTVHITSTGVEAYHPILSLKALYTASKAGDVFLVDGFRI